MNNISNSAILILASAVFSFSNPTLAIVALSLGVFGAIISYTMQVNEKNQKSKDAENVADNITSIISGLAAGSREKDNLH